jgi:hypothetical protein
MSVSASQVIVNWPKVIISWYRECLCLNVQTKRTLVFITLSVGKNSGFFGLKLPKMAQIILLQSRNILYKNQVWV